MPAPSPHRPRPTALILGAFGVIYLVWGSMFLAVRIAVQAIPPFVTGATRNLVAGPVLVGIGLAGVYLVVSA